jgi:hypothetical protein
LGELRVEASDDGPDKRAELEREREREREREGCTVGKSKRNHQSFIREREREGRKAHQSFI